MTRLTLAPFPPEDYQDWLDDQKERRFRWQYLPLFHDVATARSKVDAVAGMAPHTGATELRLVEGEGRRRGWVWLRRDEEPVEDLLLLDADVDAPAEDLLRLLVAERGGATNLLVDRMAQAPTPSALVQLAGMTPTATNMALRVTEGRGGAEVTLSPMSPEYFATWREQNLLSYATEVEGSTTATHDEAMKESREALEELLPQGLATPDQFVMVAHSRAGEDLGVMWVARRSPTAYFIYEMEIEEHQRGHGRGREVMQAAEAWVAHRGGRVLALNVYGANTVARRLYDSLGYQVVVEECLYEIETSTTR